MLFRPLLAASVLALVTTPVLAEPGGRAKMGERILARFTAADSNGDGAVTAEEMAAVRAARFAQMDADGNGSVTREEFDAAARKAEAERRAKAFTRRDANGDGVISAEEMASRGDRMSRADADQDGVITRAEIDALIAKIAERQAN